MRPSVPELTNGKMVPDIDRHCAMLRELAGEASVVGFRHAHG